MKSDAEEADVDDDDDDFEGELRDEKGFRVEERFIEVLNPPRLRLPMIIESKRVICVAIDERAEVDGGAGIVLSRSLINSLKAVILLVDEMILSAS